jgi:hypothetical protein
MICIMTILAAAALGFSSPRLHDLAEPTPAAAPGQSGAYSLISSLDEEQRVYYMDIFGHTAKVCALPEWRSLTRAVL